MDGHLHGHADATAAADAANPRRQPSTRAEVRNDTIASGGDPWTDDAPLDLDTCRICRGEATDGEPLFFPCKCSGSIKYVHQDCLMEWLSHSQKKHCELCKTPFRFTKLYSPDMPKHLPFHVFVHHMTRYLLRNVLVWLRAALVTTVWLGWLPYLMRSIWSFLFWLSDEGFGGTMVLMDPRNLPPSPGPGMDPYPLASNTCAASPLLAATTTPASLALAIEAGDIYQFPADITRAVARSLNVSVNSWMRIFFGLSAQPQILTQEVLDDASAALLQRLAKKASHTHRSLLTDVGFLNRITKNPGLNRIIINVLEGQIITLLAIVCFILIILVRDYVVQQQPEINMRAAFAAVDDVENEAAPPVPAAQPAQPEEPEEPAEPAEPAPLAPPIPHIDIPTQTSDSEGDDGEVDVAGIEEDVDNDHVTTDNDESRNLRPTDPLPEIYRPNFPQRPMVGMGRRPILNIPDQVQTSRGSSPVSPRSPRSFLDEGQPGFLREPSPLGVERDSSSGRTTIGEFVRIYRAADGDNDRIREIIRQEGLDEARFGRFIHNRSSSPSPSSMVAEKACSDSSSWTWAGSDDENDVTNATASPDKGKGRADDGKNEQEREESSTSDGPSHPSTSRSRATSDGPKIGETINPFANNSWSFSNLPSDNPEQASIPEAGGPADQPIEAHLGIDPIPNSADTSAEVQAPTSVSEAIPSDNQSRQHSTVLPELTVGQDVQEASAGPIDHLADAAGAEPIAPFPNAEARRVVPPPQPEQPNTIANRVADFMWGDVPPADADAVHQEPVDIFGDNQNPPFMHGGHDGEDEEDDEPEEDQMAPDVVEAAVAAGLDPEAVEEAEDFDGIMELIGMRGPIVGLFQNAVFCAFLVSISIFLGVFVPYNIGRVAAWFLASPTRVFRVLFTLSKLVQDIALLAVGYTSTFIFNIVEAVRLLIGSEHGKQILRSLRLNARQITTSATEGVASSFLYDLDKPIPANEEILNFSAISHQALLELKGSIRFGMEATAQVLLYIFGGDYLSKWSDFQGLWATVSSAMIAILADFPNIDLRPSSSWFFDLKSPDVSPPLNLALAYWGASDRSWAILLGYSSLTLIAALYLGRGTMFSTNQAAQEWEASIIDALNQASGVMKVILIISIEMLVFPLYCGLLLDVALLPLFEQTTLKSRFLFAYNYPLTSIFVHWFIGTGYMFHFALFVSMCRKIMRKGVLYFIRDPDDPEFHPVRDVLERNVSTQLRKILFSAFVYGALVVICLGGVVWGLSITLPHVLPIHYTYNEPVLEFPVDLLFCNFLMPLAVKFFKPSDGLHTMYTWWFRQCARALRLTWFLFGERRVDEEGKLVPSDTPNQSKLLAWRNMFLGVNEDDQVALKSWKDFFSDGDLKPTPKISSIDMRFMNGQKSMLVESGKLIPDGRFVLSPASDQAKISKGKSVFMTISEQAMADMHENEWPTTDSQSENPYQTVYIPPWFRTRISIFIMSIWFFAAVTGVGSTILPLVLGRHIFQALVPAHIRTNDIYAFSIGVYVLSSASYLVFHLQAAYDTVREWTASTANTLLGRNAVYKVAHLAGRTVRLTYAYSILLVVFPILITALVEMYVLIPLHTYMGKGTGVAIRLESGQDGHTVRIIQAWTLGILYLKLGSRALTLYGGRPAQAVRAVLRHGWLQPDIGVLTRAFVIPGLIASAGMLLLPPVFAWATLNWALESTAKVSYEVQVSAYRLAYPLTALFWAALLGLRRLLRVFQGWQVRIRDEAYLMGERLHNFSGAAAKSSSWRGGTRI
ncbi:hypothetical protein F4808DRAFT_458590 [Astrocystis sublimbata]|nr:hypothetical protein F4808DRAFT_458590 [Astrocystis sublimbata]